jgi:hypothetical protein
MKDVYQEFVVESIRKQAFYLEILIKSKIDIIKT